MYKYIEAALETLSPANAQKLAKSMAPDAAKDQVTKAAQDLIEWSQRNRDRLRSFVAKEVKEQLSSMGVATRTEVDALRKRVRELERASGQTVTKKASTSGATAKTPAKRATTARSTAKTTAKRQAARSSKG